MVCLGDGHDGVWKLINDLATPPTRCEILDWYHLSENLYKVGGSQKRLKKAESFLWEGKIDQAITLFTDCRNKQARKFEEYLNKHRQRIVNYKYHQKSGFSSIGSGAVESAIKQIDLRLKLVGAQWKAANVNQMLQLCSCYLNGQLAIWYFCKNGMLPDLVAPSGLAFKIETGLSDRVDYPEEVG